MKRQGRYVAALGAAVLMILPAAWAQKPKSNKERDAIIAVQNAKTPDERIAAIENVLTKFADTEFKPILLQMALDAAQQKNDYAQTVFYAQRILDSNPKDAMAETTLAVETARHTREFDLDKDEKLAKAEKWAKEAIANAPTMPKLQANTPDDQWEAMKKDTVAQAHEALGMVATVRKDKNTAINEFKLATELEPTPDPATYARLGQAYLDAGKLDEANAAFDKAISLPNATEQIKQVVQTAKAQIAKMKASGGGAATPAPTPGAPSSGPGTNPGGPVRQ